MANKGGRPRNKVCRYLVGDNPLPFLWFCEARDMARAIADNLGIPIAVVGQMDGEDSRLADMVYPTNLIKTWED